jgi:ABC-type nitrate/sulfonate/bicarbonate transport system substrate-binding protein
LQQPQRRRLLRLLWCRRRYGADPVPIRVGWVAPVANFASILLMKPELMPNQGKTYDLQPQHFASTPTMIPALAANQIDIGSISYAAFANAIGPSQMILWAARAGFIEKNRAALVDLLTDTIRARRFYTDPANHAEAVKIAAEFSKQPAESLDSWLFTKDGDYYHDPDDRPNMKAFQANIDTQHEQGFLKATLDVSKYADLSIVTDAARIVEGSK